MSKVKNRISKMAMKAARPSTLNDALNGYGSSINNGTLTTTNGNTQIYGGNGGYNIHNSGTDYYTETTMLPSIPRNNSDHRTLSLLTDIRKYGHDIVMLDFFINSFTGSDKEAFNIVKADYKELYSSHKDLLDYHFRDVKK